MGHLQKFHEKYERQGLFVYAISMHPDREIAQQMTREMGIRYPVFDGYDSQVGERYAYG